MLLPKDSSNSVHSRHQRKAVSLRQVVASSAYLQQRVLFLQRVQNCFLCTAFNCRLGLLGWRVRHEALTLLRKPPRSKRMYISCLLRASPLPLELNNTSSMLLIAAAAASIIAATSPLPFFQFRLPAELSMQSKTAVSELNAEWSSFHTRFVFTVCPRMCFGNCFICILSLSHCKQLVPIK